MSVKNQVQGEIEIESGVTAEFNLSEQVNQLLILNEQDKSVVLNRMSIRALLNKWDAICDNWPALDGPSRIDLLRNGAFARRHALGVGTTVCDCGGPMDEWVSVPSNPTLPFEIREERSTGGDDKVDPTVEIMDAVSIKTAAGMRKFSIVLNIMRTVLLKVCVDDDSHLFVSATL